MLIKLIGILFLTLYCLICPAMGEAIRMHSPGAQVKASITLAEGKLSYRIEGGGMTVLHPSALGIKLNGIAYGTHAAALTLKREWLIVDSLHTDLTTPYRVYLLVVQEQGKEYEIEFRLSDEGCAFRYRFHNGPYIVAKELTTFVLPSVPVWFFERNNDWKLKTYAGLWTRTLTDSLHLISKQGPIQGKPLVFELTGGKFALLTEAALYDYSGLRFRALGQCVLQADLTEKQGFQVNNKGLLTPWRVLLVAENLNRLVNNTMIRDLNPSPETKLFADISYIKPGRSVWSWITKGDKYLDLKEEMRFIDAASVLKFEYTLIDEGWETKWTDKWEQLKELCDFATRKNVGVWVWKHSKGLKDAHVRDRFLDSIKNIGVVGIKTDFMDSEAKELIDFEVGLLKAAAKRKLMVNFHGCQAPTGESKTFPNEMTREGVRGIELNIMGEPIPAQHNASLPFTRFVLGYGDYTPGLFYNKANTTYTHQLALLYLFNSSLQCLAENPVRLLADRRFKPVIPLLQDLPVMWDETIVLEGSAIGELAVFARRKDDQWYVVAINGTESDKKVSLQPSFLTNTGNYEATLITDKEDLDGFGKEEFIIRRNGQKDIMLKPNGGMVINLKQKHE